MSKYLYIYITVCFSFSFNLAKAQTAVGARSTSHGLEIVTPAGYEKTIITKDGKVGIGTLTPKVELDIRSEANSALALGMTEQSAQDAGAGAIRYVPSPAIGVKGYIEYSDGEKWIGYHPYGKPRLVVVAEKSSQDVYVYETGAQPIGSYSAGIPARSSSYLTNWTKKLDSDSGTDTNNFNATNGEFIAPREGVYWAIFSMSLQSNLITANETYDSNQIEAIWEVRDSSGLLKSKIKSAKAFPGNGTAEVGTSCLVGVHLMKGDKLRPAVWIDLIWNHSSFRPFNTNPGYNVLTIVEQ